MKVKISQQEVDQGEDLSQAMKYTMFRCGIFEFELSKFKQATCCCGHSRFEHIDCIDCCIVKSKEICICDGFKEKGVISTKKKIPYQRIEQERTEDVVVKEGKVIQQDQDRFMKQYGII
ncbi:MAG: hypothetical protein WCC17_10850 [Candidatus Nitrosopolaris sp.]